jgi:hypothetical protein
MMDMALHPAQEFCPQHGMPQLRVSAAPRRELPLKTRWGKRYRTRAEDL